ncbi:gamma-glutamyltransferase family protein [Nocardioides antri]|uniref:gamma-glutamyltransferase family protein n=1 Tax=Nocardioides antri TaxID=2607659 RepID=UPI00165F2B6C|nr:gamma-glutamyltransferase [Nocardioides antri]
MTPQWAVASPHRTASDAAADVFRSGGNAVDAALAAAVTLTVVYPNQCSLGGDVMALIGAPDGHVHAVNGSGRSPRASDVARLGPTVGGMPVYGPFTVTVPGAVAAWHDIADRYGTLSLAPTLLAAAELAGGGVEVAPGLARDLEREESRLLADDGMRAVFTRHGSTLRSGSLLEQVNLARSLTLLAEGGAEAFYDGPVGKSLVRRLRQLGSAMSAEDLASHRTSFDDASSAVYAGHELVSGPPGSQGIFFLEGMAALEVVRERLGHDLDPLGDDAGVIAAVLSAAAQDRDRLLGDPDSSPLDIDSLLGRRARTVAESALLGDPSPRRTQPTRATGDTVAVVAADGAGTWVSLIQSNFHAFGSGILDESSGIVLHNRGASFVLDPSSPNVYAGGRRPAHTLMPVLVRRSDSWTGAHGTMGGRAQPQIHTQLALHLAAGRTSVEAVTNPRFVLGPTEPGAGDPSPRAAVKVEADLPGEARDALAGAGFDLAEIPAHDDGAGHSQLVRRNGTTLEAASDPRADGAARTHAG